MYSKYRVMVDFPKTNFPKFVIFDHCTAAVRKYRGPLFRVLSHFYGQMKILPGVLCDPPPRSPAPSHPTVWIYVWE